MYADRFLPSLQIRSPLPRESFERLLTLLALLALLLQILIPVLPSPQAFWPTNQRSDWVSASAQPDAFPAAPAHPPAMPYTLPPELQGKSELTGLRTSHSATFEMGDGRFAVMQEILPLNYRDGFGRWQAINPAYSEIPLGFANQTNQVRSVLARSRSDARIAGGGAGVAWEPTALELTGAWGSRSLATRPYGVDLPAGRLSADQQSITYENHWTLPGLTDRWQSGRGRVEYTMRLERAPDPGLLPVRYLDLSVNLSLRPGTRLMLDGAPVSLPLETKRPIEFVAADGEPLLLMPPAAFEEEASDVRVNGIYLLEESDDPAVIRLRLRLPWSWLAEPDRNYPVIIDPLFQMQDGTLLRNAEFTGTEPPQTFTIQDRGDNALLLGRTASHGQRILMRFTMPPMPTGSSVEEAYLYAVPTGIAGGQKSLSFGASLFRLIRSDWQSKGSGQSITLGELGVGSQLPIFGDFVTELSKSDGEPNTLGMRWNVTSAVNFGTLFDGGLMLQAFTERCRFGTDPIHHCNAFEFEDKWEEWEIDITQKVATPGNPSVVPSPRGGLRLIVFYSSATLTVGQTRSTATPLGNNGVYHHADHIFNLPSNLGRDGALPRWQAVVVRGRSDAQSNAPAPGSTFDTVGKSPLSLREIGGNSDILAGLPNGAEPHEVNYFLFNGRGSLWNTVQSPGLELRVSSPDAGPPSHFPSAVEVAIVKETASLAPAPGSSRTVDYIFDSELPMALWNLSLQPNTNNRVVVTLEGDNANINYASQNAKNFKMHVVRSDSQAELVAANNNSKGRKSLKLGDGVSSAIFSAENGQNYGLAVAYSGPHVTDVVMPTPNGRSETGGDTPKLNYNIKVRVTSCAAGTYPTTDGDCQKVECPNALWPNNPDPYQHVDAGNHGVGLWSKSGWQNQSGTFISINSDTAPLIGPRGESNAPNMAIVGGTITRSGDSVTVNDKSTILLLSCPAPSGVQKNPSEVFHVYDGPMQRDIRLFGGPTIFQIVSVMEPTGTDNDIFANPWLEGDRGDLDPATLDFFVRPGTGEVISRGRLTREVEEKAAIQSAGPDNVVKEMKFDTSWSFEAGGWSTLDADAKLIDENPVTTVIASLTLDLGSDLDLEATPANGDDERYITQIRAKKARISQTDALGGASKPVQAVILNRGMILPIINRACTTSTTPLNCIDIRSVDDQPGAAFPNRSWDMPDVHTDINARTVVMRQPGAVEVWSKDHPALQPASTGSFSKDFNFDAFNARVTVDVQPCLPQDPTPVLVIIGQAGLELPSVGAGGQISAGFKLCETQLRNVNFSFQSPVGIPLGSTGFFLTGISGDININPGYVQIQVHIHFQAAPGPDGGIIKVSGGVLIDTRGLFELQASGRLLGTVDVSGKLWVAWNPLDTGLDVSLSFSTWLVGRARVHLWQGQGWQNRYAWLPDNDDTHFTAQISATFIIREGDVATWGPISIPPFDISIKLELAFGEFCTNNSCTTFEWGIKGVLEISGFGIGMYFGFDSGFDFILGTSDHILIDQFGGGVSAATSRGLRFGEAPQLIDGTAFIDFTVSTESEELLAVLGWEAGAPSMTLIDPNGTEIAAENLGAGIDFTDSANQRLIGIKRPIPGAWKAMFDNVSADGTDRYKFIYFSSKGQPGDDNERGEFVKPVAQDEAGTGSYTIEWKVPTETTADATISLYYSRTQVISGNLELQVPIVRNLPFSQGNYQWDTSLLRNGSYLVMAEVDDGVNELPPNEISRPVNRCLPTGSGLPPARAFAANRFPGVFRFTSVGTVMINDSTAPAPPTGLELTPVGDAFMARWAAPADRDVAAYLVQWGPRNGGTFTVKNTKFITAKSAPWTRIGAVDAGVEYGVHVIAVDVNENESGPSAVAFATPDVNADPIPLPPVDLVRTGGTSTSASFSWAADSAGAAPTGYRLHVFNIRGGSVQSVDVGTTSGTVNDLATGLSYDVGVTAGNGAGYQSIISDTVRIVVTNGVDGNGDGLPDDWASVHNVSGSTNDPDGDGVNNGKELENGTDPNRQDSDGDDYTDKEEMDDGTDPLASASYGAAPSQPRLVLSSDHLRFRAAGASEETLFWSNAGGGTLTIEASTNSPWIQTNITADSVLSGTIKVTVDRSGLNAGFHSGVVALSPAAGSDPLIGESACIRVDAWIGGPPKTILYFPALYRQD